MRFLFHITLALLLVGAFLSYTDRVSANEESTYIVEIKNEYEAKVTLHIQSTDGISKLVVGTERSLLFDKNKKYDNLQLDVGSNHYTVPVSSVPLKQLHITKRGEVEIIRSPK